jgi:hypothetical protein
MIIEDRLGLGKLMVQSLGGSSAQEKIFVNEFHGNGIGKKWLEVKDLRPGGGSNVCTSTHILPFTKHPRLIQYWPGVFTHFCSFE